MGAKLGYGVAGFGDSALYGVFVSFYLLVLLFYFTAYTIFYVPWTAFGAEITSDYDERSSVMSYRMGWSALGAVPGGALPLNDAS